MIEFEAKFTEAEFERFVRNIGNKLPQEIATMAVTPLSRKILDEFSFDPRLNPAGSQFRGPAGRTISTHPARLIRFGEAVARMVLELAPRVRFITIRAKDRPSKAKTGPNRGKTVRGTLAFDWFKAPLGVASDRRFRKTFPRVFFAKVRVPIRIPLGEPIKEKSLEAFTSEDFHNELAQFIKRGLIRL